MPDNPRLPTSRRKPGRLVRIQDLLPPSPPKELTVESVGEYVKGLVTFLQKLTANQDDLNRYLWMMEGSLPGKHAKTHMGGDDSTAYTALPEPVGPPGTLPQRGDPHLGFSPGNHIHELDLGGLEDLLGVDIDPIYGVAVTDFKLQQALEDILFALNDIIQIEIDRNASGDDSDDVLAFLGM